MSDIRKKIELQAVSESGIDLHDIRVTLFYLVIDAAKTLEFYDAEDGCKKIGERAGNHFLLNREDPSFDRQFVLEFVPEA